MFRPRSRLARFVVLLVAFVALVRLSFTSVASLVGTLVFRSYQRRARH